MQMDSSDTRKRNMEKRRETSRYAARDRRGKETEIFSDLRAVVPIVDEGTVTHLDRIAVLRVSCAWCRIRKTAPNVLKPLLVGPESTKIGQKLWCEETITEALDGFIIIADSDGTILCVTESVCLYLGLSQTDLVGRSLKEFLHPSDYADYMEVTSGLGSMLVEHQDINRSPECGIYVEMRMKTVITQRGRNLNLKSALYKSISFILRAERSLCGHVVRLLATSEPAGQGSPNVHANTLNKFADTPAGSFMTRHTSDMRISYIHDRLNYILRNELKSLMGTSFFELIDPSDLPTFRESMKTLFAKGHVRTLLYRLLAANHTVVWMITDASTVNHTSKGQRAQYVICVHHIAGIKSMAEERLTSKGGPIDSTVQIKKEIDDIREYAGRQPHIDASGAMDFQMQPLTGREDFSMMTRLLSFTENATMKAVSGRVHGSSLSASDGSIDIHEYQCHLRGSTTNRKRAARSGEKSDQTYSDTFFRGQSQRETQHLGQQESNSPTSVSTLAPAHIMATTTRTLSDGNSSARCGCVEDTGEESSTSAFAKSASQHGFCNSSLPSQSKIGARFDRCVGSGQSSTRPRCVSAVCASDNIALSSILPSNGECDDTSSLLSSLSAAITRSSTNGSVPTITDYQQVSLQTAPIFEDIPFEEPNIDDIVIRAPYISRRPSDNIGAPMDDLSLCGGDIGAVDLSSEDFNSMFEQVISQSRPSAGRAVLRCTPSDSYMQRYPATDPTVSGLPATSSHCSRLSPPLKRSSLDSVYDDRELRSSSANTGFYCSSNLFWPTETVWSDQERRIYQQRECVYRQV